MCGSVNPVELIGNVATGGLLGAGEALAEGRPGVALENLGPFGSAVHPISPELADLGNAIGAGAGIGGGLTQPGSFTPTFGTPATAAPYYAGASAGSTGGLPFAIEGPLATPVPTYPGIALSDPLMAEAGLTFGAGSGAAAGAQGGSGEAGALLGASAAQKIAGMLGGASPLSMPQGGGAVSPTGPTGGLTKQQLDALTAMQSEKHRGIAPRFNQRMMGQREDTGIATLGDYYP